MPVRNAFQNTSGPWPGPLEPQAFYGPIGRILRAIEPGTESDPVAILVQALVAFGNAVGHGPHFRVEADRHGVNEFVGIVGNTAKARKGTSLGHVRRMISAADPVWGQRCHCTGLSSGEGLISRVRDAAPPHNPGRAERSGRVATVEDLLVDRGVDDKRLLVVEPELVRTLRAMQRDRNTLSAVLREAWDGLDLTVLTKSCPDHATAPHISVIAHIAKDELLRELDATEAAGGLANRFLWVCARRSNVLPEGGDLPSLALKLVPLEQELAETVRWAQALEDIEMTRGEDARGLWREIYPDLSAGRPGLVGAVTARAEAHVLRLSMLYALLDRSIVIAKEHLTAALAVWKYAAASCHYIFGDRLGNPVADAILRALRTSPTGLTRTEIRDRFSRHRGADEIEEALGFLVELGLVTLLREDTGGRPAERWTLVASVAQDEASASG